VRLASCGVPLDPLDQGRQIIDINAVNVGWFGDLRLSEHKKLSFM
jgi:hypothetical protein